MYMEAGMPLQPALYFLMFVSRIIGGDDMQDTVGRRVVVDETEKANPLLMAVARLAQTNYFAIGHIHCRKQCRRPMPLVIMGHGSRTTPLQRQSWLRPIHSLYLAVFINAQHDGTLGRIQIEAHNGLQLLAESRIRRIFFKALHSAG